MTDPHHALAAEIARRRTFAIISHPDAGKTTLTEKLLLYGGAIHLAGSVKSRKAARHATSDWMEMERERGISITTSVMQFTYAGRHVNLLDTPGHNDFSEDTYRTLAAADSAVMLVDAAKGVEPQTIKLFQVCRMRKIPIATFVNKMDRAGRDPFDLMDEIEKVLGIPCSPATWPIGSGPDFQGVYDRWSKKLLRYERGETKGEKLAAETFDLGDPSLVEEIGEKAHAQLVEELAMLDAAGMPFDRDLFLAGELTPVFFGSALNDFGVEPFLAEFLELAPGPAPRQSSTGTVDPAEPRFSGFVFKIQANMDPAHRDRVAFVRVCSGKFTRGMEVRHARTGRTLKLNKPLQFLAQERTLVDEAWAGDVLGLWDSGALRIGDTIHEGPAVEYAGIPRFSPELFCRVVLLDPLKRKQLKKGLDQLSEEGAVQVFYDPVRLERDPILGAVGALQFEVIQHRLRAEYGADVSYARLPHQIARWIENEGFDPRDFDDPGRCELLADGEGRPLVLFESEWHFERAKKTNPRLTFAAAVQPARAR
ncbi:MAG: peptide chain release factor 3 [Thermoanaerobaculia bacterium]